MLLLIEGLTNELSLMDALTCQCLHNLNIAERTRNRLLGFSCFFAYVLKHAGKSIEQRYLDSLTPCARFPATIHCTPN